MSCIRVSAALLLLVLLLHSSAAAAAELNSLSSWKLLHENLTEYSPVLNATTPSLIECLTLPADQQQAVTYSSDTQQCRVYACRLGDSGCRKCRNLSNRSLPQVWLLMSSNSTATSSIGCWRTFQHRVDASVDFYRNWTQYVIGFGQGEDANFWLGLSKIHELTMSGDKRVRWEFSDWNSSFYWAENEFLRVENEVNKFKAWLGPYDATRSNVGQNSIGSTSINGMKFTTFDDDNDARGGSNCAVTHTGAWWYRSCHNWNPNGRYFTPPQALNILGNDFADGVVYNVNGVPPLSHTYSMMSFECMLWHWM